MSRMSVSRSAMAAARYRPRLLLRGALGLAPRRADAALGDRAALVAARAELVLDEVAGLAGDDRELEHGGPFGGGSGRRGRGRRAHHEVAREQDRVGRAGAGDEEADG